jgi:molybdopterin molybdotransferase
VVPGAAVRKTGEEIVAGSLALTAGSLIHPLHLHTLASLGATRVRVHEQPRVNILATGDELVEPDEEPGEGQIRNSTVHVLAAIAAGAGANAELRGAVPDKRKRIRKAIRENLDCDALVLTGGVSTGPYDIVPKVLEEAGADIRVRGVKMKPGRPFTFALLKDTPVFALPGNPLSAIVAFLQFTRPAIWKMSGRSRFHPPRITAVLDEPTTSTGERRGFLSGVAVVRDGTLYVQPVRGQNSARLTSLAAANCFIVVPEGEEVHRAGDRVTVEPLEGVTFPNS